MCSVLLMKNGTTFPKWIIPSGYKAKMSTWPTYTIYKSYLKMSCHEWCLYLFYFILYAIILYEIFATKKWKSDLSDLWDIRYFFFVCASNWIWILAAYFFLLDWTIQHCNVMVALSRMTFGRPNLNLNSFFFILDDAA